MAAAPRRMLGGHVGKTELNHDGGRTSDNDLAYQNFPRGLSGMLLDYAIRCDTDPNTEPPAGVPPGAKLPSSKYCGNWIACNPDGKELPEVASLLFATVP